MVYCIVEGKTDIEILSIVFRKKCPQPVKIIMSGGFPSMPAVARTIMSYIEIGDRVMIVCDQESFDNVGYKRDMFGFLLRGASNNPAFKLFTFSPNIDILIPGSKDDKTSLKGNPAKLQSLVIDNMEEILKNETIQGILEFAQHGRR